MRPELIVLLVVFAISAVVDWACLVMASRADDRAEKAEAELKKERERKKNCSEKMDWMFYEDGTVYFQSGSVPDESAKEKTRNEHQD